MMRTFVGKNGHKLDAINDTQADAFRKAGMKEEKPKEPKKK